MTRDKALEILRDFIGWEDGTTVGIRHDVLEAFAALSSPCACGGAKVLAAARKIRADIHPRRSVTEANACRGLDTLIASLESQLPCACGGEEPFVKLGGIDLVYNPDDERHWLKVGLFLERGSEDINNCRVIVLKEKPNGG